MSNCFKCGRFLGAKEEWKKMETSYGKICYVCFNRIRADQDRGKESNSHNKTTGKIDAGKSSDSQDRKI